MINLLKKDLLVFKKYFIYTFLFYIMINIILLCFLIIQKIFSLKAIGLIIFLEKSNLQGLIIIIPILLVILFNYLIIVKENYSLTYALNVSKKEIYNSKLILGSFYVLINLIFYIYTYFIYDSLINYLILTNLRQSLFVLYFYDTIAYTLFISFFSIALGINLIHTFSISSCLLKSYHPNIKLLYKLLIVITIIIFVLIYIGTCAFIKEYYYESIIYFYFGFIFLFSNICLYLLNIYLVKKVDI